MTLNISAEQSIAANDEPGRRALADAVIAELSSWNPREFVGAFRRWHHGSLSLIHLNVLTLLEVEGPLSMSRLAEALDVSVASATGIVDRMEQRGLVERQHDLDDRRVVIVHPAPGGAKIFDDIDERRRLGLGRLLVHLTDAELSGLLAGHRALRVARMAAIEERAAAESSGSAAGATKS